MNWILIQQIVISIMAAVVILSGIIGLIRVIPEINAICNEFEDEKSRDGRRDSNS